MPTSVPKRYKYGIMLFVKSLIIVFAVVSFMLCLFSQYPDAIFPERGNIVLALLYLFILFTMTITYGCFKIGKVRLKELTFSYFISQLLTNFFSYFILSLIAEVMLNPLPILTVTLIQFLFGVLVYIVSISLHSFLFSARDTLLVCGKSDYDFLVTQKLNKEHRRFDIRQIIIDNHSYDDICDASLQYSTMIIGTIDEKLKLQLIEFCFVNKIQLYTIPSISDLILQGSHFTNVDDSLLLFSRNQALTLEQKFIKRAIDLFISSLVLLLTSPLMIIFAVVIKLYDKGPVFFKQKRYTYDGKVFTLIKFRSMVPDAEKDGAQFTVNEDPRVTPVGRIIRAMRIDELPQIFNIFLGDMSLVGPRPERVENVDMYSSVMPEFKYRLKVKAGLTGFAQLYGKYNTSFEDKARMDIYYIVNYSLLLDIKLLFYTLKVIFSKESTDGFLEKTSSDIEVKNSPAELKDK